MHDGEMKVKFNVKSSDVKRIKQLYVSEYNFISDLLENANLPSLEEESSDSEDGSSQRADDIAQDSDIIKNKTSRAKTLDELHKRIEALREEKYTYRGKIIKKKLQNKLKRKRKILENKTKRNIRKKEKIYVDNRINDKNNTDVKPVKPVFNKDGNLVFSKFDFLGEKSTANDVKTSKKDTNIQHTLKKIEKSNNYIRKLEDAGEKEKVNKIREAMAWNNALKKTEGIKIKDDPLLLKKKLNKKVAEKKASKKKWDNRIKMVEQQKRGRQQKRNENIKKRKDDKVKKKIKKAVKKGRYIPK